MQFAHPIIRDEYFLNASPESVHRLIHDTWMARESKFRQVIPPDLERKLLDRKDTLINLALAQYSNNEEILQELYITGNKAIRISVLSNTNENIFPKGRKWLTEEHVKNICNDPEESYAFFRNSLLSESDLESVFLRNGLYKEIADDAWRTAVYHAAHNPNVTEPEIDDPYATDGWKDYRNSLPRKALWSLLESWDVTPINVRILSAAFYDNKAPFELPVSSSDLDTAITQFFAVVLDKWTAKNSKDGSVYYEDGKEIFELEMLREGIASRAPRYRKSVMELLKNHPDINVRRGYYQIFSPTNVEQIASLFQKDGKHFLETAILNDQLYEAHAIDMRKEFHHMVHYKREGIPDIEFESMQRIREIYDIRAQKLSTENPARYIKDPDDYVDIKMTDGAIATSSLNAVQQIYDNISEMSKKMIAKNSFQSDLPEILSMISKLQRDSMDAVLTRINLLEKRFKQVLIWFTIAFVALYFISRR
jgi:hypothetical protein